MELREWAFLAIGFAAGCVFTKTVGFYFPYWAAI